MIKLILLAAVGYFLWRMFSNDRKKKAEQSEKEKEVLVSSGKMVKDPICGAYIDATSSITVRDGSTVHRFCSYECRDEFLKRIGKQPGISLEKDE